MSNAYVMVPVPPHLVPVVCKLVADDSNAAAQTAPSIPPTVAILQRIWKESGPAMKKVFKVLIEAEGNTVTSKELALSLYGNTKGHRLAGAMGAFGRRCKNRYNGVRPFTASWNHTNGVWEYTMPKDVADVLSPLT